MSLFKSAAIALLVIASSAKAAPGVHGPNGEHLSGSAPATNTLSGRQADGSVLITMAEQQLLHIRTLMATRSTTSRYVTLDAVVQHHPSGRALVQSGSDGRLDAGPGGLPVSGQRVQAGDVLGYVRYQDTAYELASQTGELIALRSEIEQAVRDLKRLDSLGNLVAMQEREQLQNRVQRLQQQEQVLQQGLEKPEVLLAPISGIIQNDNISRGQWVKAGPPLFEIIDPTQWLIEATTTDSTLLSALTTAVLAQQPQWPLQFVGHSPRLQQGQIVLFFSPENRDDSIPLVAGQPVRLHAPLATVQEGIVLPASALVHNSNHLPIVWIKLSAERLLSQRVQYQQLDPERILIQEGLGDDNRVVVQGASLLNQIR